MKKANIYLLIAGIINLTTFFLHLIGGQIDLVNPMMNSSITLEKTSQLLGAWHMVTIILLVSSIILLLAALRKKYSSNKELIVLIGYLNLLFCIPFIAASLYYKLMVPQWILFLPIGILTLIGSKRI